MPAEFALTVGPELRFRSRPSRPGTLSGGHEEGGGGVSVGGKWRLQQVKTWLLAYVGAAVAEIAGCFAFWAWLRMGKSAWWLLPGVAALVAFAYLLTLVEVEHAGRAFAAYGGVYILSAIVWMWIFEGARPDRWDALGALVCIIGAGIILFGPRTPA